jgi:hypothetical protein
MISYLLVLRKGTVVRQHGERNAEHYSEEKLTDKAEMCFLGANLPTSHNLSHAFVRGSLPLQDKRCKLVAY